ncbi:MAG: hypothetical protein EPN84_07680 [Legionella sp.]|nr:MAG: hypothetical protein EPN84_07680 [Legionella sp.]
MDNEQDLDRHTEEFIQAMDKYENQGYHRIEILTSFFNVSLQALSLFNLFYFSSFSHTSIFVCLFVLFITYLITDLVNGLVHMMMDNNTHYTSVIGPLVAVFHLHHAKLVYKVRPLLRVYFDESGAKFWLFFYLLSLVICQFTFSIPTPLNLGLVAFGIFSTLSEISHYWCHNATEENTFILWLQEHHILLSKAHHKAHHKYDNVQYAFLNGVSDPIIDYIARWRFKNKGYKNYADKHTKVYMKRKAQ